MQADIVDVTTNLSKYIDMVNSGEETEIIITQGEVPWAKIVPCNKPVKVQPGVANGKFSVPDDFDELI